MKQQDSAVARKRGRTVHRENAEPRTHRITETLQERIASQQLSPGSRLQEADLASEFGSSRTVIREVLGALEQRGLVLRVPNRGAVVRRLEEKEVYEIFEVREALEGLMTHKATIEAPDGHWAPFIAEFEGALEKRISEGDIGVYNDALDKLRTETLRIANNDIASSFLSQIMDKTRIIKIRVTLLPGRAEAGRQMHLSMLRHMAAREADDAQEIKRQIIRTARDLFTKYRALIL